VLKERASFRGCNSSNALTKAGQRQGTPFAGVPCLLAVDFQDQFQVFLEGALGIRHSTDQLVPRRSINTDAFAPSIDVIGKKIRAHDETLDPFNRFSESESDTVHDVFRQGEVVESKNPRQRGYHIEGRTSPPRIMRPS
jgi:hypothetical protein